MNYTKLAGELKRGLSHYIHNAPLSVLCYMINLVCVFVLIATGISMWYIQAPAVVLSFVFAVTNK